MKVKWKLVSADGLRTIGGDDEGVPFATKKAAQLFADEMDGEWKTERVATEEPVPPEPEGDDKPNDDKRDIDVDAITREAGKEGVQRALDLIADADMGGPELRSFVVDALRENPGCDQAELRRTMHTRWKAAQKKANPSAGNPSPPENTGGRTLEKLDDDAFIENVTRTNLSDIHIVNTPMLRAPDFRALLNNDAGNFQKRVNDLLARKDGDKGPALKPDMISIKASYELLGDVPCREIKRVDGQLRAITTTAFAILTGSTVIAKIREAYDNVAMIGDQLVTTMGSSTAIDTIPAVLTEDSIQEVGEGQDYKEAGATEEYVTIGHRKQGGIIRVTRETIQFDQTGTFLVRVNRLGEDAANRIEKLTLQRITDDLTGSAIYVYKPSGTGTALYSTTARARGTNKKAANALVDATDLASARKLLAAMTKHNGDPINALPKVLLIPDALVETAAKILGSELTPGTENELNPWGPRGLWRPKVISSPYLDTFTSGTSNWYLGDPQRQFIKKQVFGIETTTKGAESDAAFTADVIFQARVAFDVEVGATDYVYWIQSAA